MTIKKRITSISNHKAIESLANDLADKPYGEKQNSQQHLLTRTTISLPMSVLVELEDLARENKRNKNDLKSVSAIIRDCIMKCLKI